jgi:FtsP/CotA-like multicopper oxidase with cupredoxin domain
LLYLITRTSENKMKTILFYNIVFSGLDVKEYLSKVIPFTITILVLVSLTGTGMIGGGVTAKATVSAELIQQYDIEKGCAKNTALVPNMTEVLTNFNCGHVTQFNNGTTLRQFTLIIEENHKIPISMPEDTNKTIQFPAWTFNASIPGPIMRMTKGDHVEVKVVNEGTMAHSLHMHSIHPGNMDGVPIVSGDSGFIPPGQSFTYKFIANPVGVFPYHCHMVPVSAHINRGLYGGLIIDPPFNNARPRAQEIVMYLNGYDLNLKAKYPRFPTFNEANSIMAGNTSEAETLPSEHDNALYSVNGIANYYMHHPIPVKIHQLLRIYMFNMLDFEENSFHLHGQVFDYYPAGTSTTPSMTNDMLVLSQGDRGIIETQFNYAGLYMTHAHFEQVGSRGWSALFSVK